MSPFQRDSHRQQPSDDDENKLDTAPCTTGTPPAVSSECARSRSKSKSESEPGSGSESESESKSTTTATGPNTARTARTPSGRHGEDPDSISRPSLYSHQPRPRRAPFEAYFDDHFGDSAVDGRALRAVEILDVLKSDRLEGVYNLSFLVLAFALTYLFVRNVVDHGFLAGPSAICFSILFRDLLVLTLFIVPMPLLFLVPFSLIVAHAKKTPSVLASNRVVLAIHFTALAAFFAAATKLLFVLQLNPLLGVVAGIVVMIVALKAHSYVMTNLLLAEETELRRKSRRRPSPSPTPTPTPTPTGHRTTASATATTSASKEKSKKNQSNRVDDDNVDNATAHSCSSSSAPATTAPMLRKRLSRNAVSTDADDQSSPTPPSSDDADTEVEGEGEGEGETEIEGKRVSGGGGGLGREMRHGFSHGHGHGHGKSAGVKYPTNVTLSNLAYFVVAPTLVYETGYPRSAGVRARYVLWHMGQIGVCLFVEVVLLMQFCVPVWRAEGSTDRLWWFSLKLALPCFFMWLLLFWGFFHCALNGIAELTRFADRLFYLDWWNATDLSQFWRTWNMPVHEWCTRHLYLETVSRQRLNRRAAILGTFLLSAVFHEYVCFVAFRMIRPYMFAGMILQIPLIEWSTALAGTRAGNYFMWIMLFVGQSWVPLLYCRDYLHMYDTLMCRPLYRRQ